MAVSTDGWISLSSAGKLHGRTGLAARSCRQVKFCNGEMMGKKLKMTQLHQEMFSDRKKHVCMSLTTELAADTKVRSFFQSQFNSAFLIQSE